jgi:PAS domain S-box-containing protein
MEMERERERDEEAAPVAAPAEAPSRILLVDDDPVQLKLHRIRLNEEGFTVETARNAEEALDKARAHRPDAIVSDVVMGDVDGFGLCRRVRADAELAKVPVILLSALYQNEGDRELAARVGASALVGRTPEFETEIEAVYQSLLNGPPRRRTDANRPEVYEHQLRATNGQLTLALEQAKRAEARYRLLFDNARDVICVVTTDGVVLESNQRAVDVFGVPPEKLVGRHIGDFALPGNELRHIQGYNEAVARREGRDLVPVRRADGRVRHVEFSRSVINIEGRDVVLSVGRDMTEIVQATDALVVAEDKYRSLVERIPEVVWSASSRGHVLFASSNAAQILGLVPEALYEGGRQVWTSRIHADDLPRVKAAFAELTVGAPPLDLEFRWSRENGRWIWLRCSAAANAEAGGGKRFDGLLSDVTEKRSLEESLRQAQKMEAIGQLTGGVAHDFNNILAVIIANSYFLVTGTADGDERRGQAEEIRAAAERAAALTRQLLAFSRKQVLQPTALDLGATVRGLEKMLRRVIGEDITLEIAGVDKLGVVRADPSQMEQVVMNLVVNARDAMPRGGRLAITTSNVDVAAGAAAEDGPAPGRYVLLSVSDDGEGMNAETRRRLFEPFFTTKERGKGTGLGLSTCYGIVKQSNGYIQVHSEPGRGARFEIYLPRVDEVVAAPRASQPAARIDGTEGVLLLEDDPSVRAAVARILRVRGYRVYMAADGPSAVEVARAHAGAIDLLLSDVIIPGGSGPEALAEVRSIIPNIKALFMSGYTDHAVLRDNNALRQEASFIQKPFAPDALVQKVRQVLDS